MNDQIRFDNDGWEQIMSPRFNAALMLALFSGLLLNEAKYRRGTGKTIFRAIAVLFQVLALLVVAPVP